MIYTIIGKRGYGKTTKAKLIVKEIAKKKKKTIIILDSENEYSGDFEFDNFNSFLIHYEKHRLVLGKIYKISISDFEDFFDMFDLLEEIEDIFIVLDEASKYTSPSFIPESLNNIVHFGRKKNQEYIVVTRRPPEINRALTSQSDILISFRVTEPNDLSYLKSYFTKEEILKVQVLNKPFYGDSKLKQLFFIEKEI